MDLLVRKRGSGKTASLIQIVKNTPNAVLVVCNALRARSVIDCGLSGEQVVVFDYDKIRGKSIITRFYIDDLEKIVRDRPDILPTLMQDCRFIAATVDEEWLHTVLLKGIRNSSQEIT